jgi:hypothetical protein
MPMKFEKWSTIDRRAGYRDEPKIAGTAGLAPGGTFLISGARDSSFD